MASAPPPRFQRRVVGVVLCGAAVASLALALAPRSWWSHRIHHDASIEVGLWSARVCIGAYSSRYLAAEHTPSVDDPDAEGWSACTTGRLGEVAGHLDANRDAFIIDDVWGPGSREQTHRLFSLAGVLTLGLGVGTSLVLIAVGIAFGARARSRVWPVLARVAVYASGGFLALAVLFVLFAPPEIDQMSLGIGFAFALAGAGFGLGAGQVLSAEDARGEGGWHAAARTGRFWRAVVVTGVGLAAVAVSLHTRTWWVDKNLNYVAKHGIRDGQTCDQQGEPRCEIETWNSQPAGATGPRPVKRLVAFRASEAAYQLGHLAVLAGLLLLLLLLQGQLVAGRWAPHRILIVTAVGFLVASVILTLGAIPESLDERARLSTGPIWALAGGAMLVWGGIAAGRLTREPHGEQPLPRARLHEG